MTIGLGAEEFDALDYSRRLIQAHSNRAADYADMLAKLIEMRDDDGADIMRRRLIAEVNGLNTSMKALAAGRLAQPAADAAATFDRMPTPEPSH